MLSKKFPSVIPRGGRKKRLPEEETRGGGSVKKRSGSFLRKKSEACLFLRFDCDTLFMDTKAERRETPMMNLLEEAIIYATVMHQGKVRSFGGSPYILHSLEVAQIMAGMTDDLELITAGILHDIVEKTDGTLEEVEKRFGSRVAALVSAQSWDEAPAEEGPDAWKQRREKALVSLKNSGDLGVRMLWLADQLANLRAVAGAYSEVGEAVWEKLHPQDPELQRWYYRSVAENVELSLNKTGAFKEFIKHINSIWPGTFDSDKARYRKYREVSVDGCELIGRGAKGEVYRFDDELIIKVYNEKNTYHDVEQEIAQSRRAFVLGIPTAISFGIVSVGSQYGSMYELVDSQTISECIAKNPGRVENYAKIMSELAHTIHAIDVGEDDSFPSSRGRLLDRIDTGLAFDDAALAARSRELLATLPESHTLVHGDFHTGNVFLQKGEPILIDMDRVSRGNPIEEISDLYYFYEVLGRDDPAVIEDFMGFSYETARAFFRFFLTSYLGTEDETRLAEVTEKAEFLCCLRMIRKMHKKGALSEAEKAALRPWLERTAELAAKLDTLCI